MIYPRSPEMEERALMYLRIVFAPSGPDPGIVVRRRCCLHHCFGLVSKYMQVMFQDTEHLDRNACKDSRSLR